jgi:restriction endonuclease S subunit
MKRHLVQLSQVGQLTQGLTYRRHVDANAEPIRVLHVADLDDLTANRGNPEREEKLDLRKNQDAQVRPGQVLIALRTSDVKAAVVPEGMDEAVASNSLTVLTVNLEVADPHFIAGLLRSKAMHHRLAPLFSGVTIQGIPLSKFRHVEIDLPPLERQAAFAEAFAAHDAYRRAINNVLSLQSEEIEAQLSPLLTEAN